MEDVLKFWFEELEEKQWWVKDIGLDKLIEDRFGELHKKANAGELKPWRETAEGRLAEVIVLDQFSRNIFRDQPGAFASDELALSLSKDAVETGADQLLEPKKRLFLYMPYMHSESLEVHNEALKLFEDLGFESNIKYEKAHRDIIERFGRYPHRNKILGRQSSNEEIEFLKEPGSSF
ncbi:MAG: hypothetical protein CME70_12430 [Halobacteriovorax sp.]|nr:hypothetical protein [Halobacteriovorax sp.]|tara:strand:- start:246191 stop:246724 length:534 start_codon:yes stop_codon:yes gene_type:complete